MKNFFTISMFIAFLLIIGGAAPLLALDEECPNDNLWNGSISTAWDAADNWDCGVVPINSNVTIPASAAPNFPILPNPGLVFVENMTVEAGASIDINGASVIMNGTLINNGTMIDRQPIPPESKALVTCFFCFGNYQGLYLSRDDTVGENPGIVEVQVSGNQGTCDSGNSTIGRCFEITPTNKENISLDAIFYFLPQELNGLTCDQLNAFHWDGEGWAAAGSHNSVDCESSTSPEYAIVTDNITDFSYFVGATGIPLAVSVVDFSPDNGVGGVIAAAFVAAVILFALWLLMRKRQVHKI